MEQIAELPDEVKRLLRNLESRSDDVVADVIEALAKLGNSDMRIILTLRRRTSEKRGWLFRIRDRALDVANLLNEKLYKDEIQRLENSILAGKASSDDLLAHLAYLQLNDTEKMNKTLQNVQRYVILLIFLVYMLFKLVSL